ncbi:MAG: hypothetical protein ABEJ57_07445 [Halobacteriaceae archaeon]
MAKRSTTGPIGVLGEHADKPTLRRAASSRDRRIVDGDPATVYAADPTLVVALDPPALRAALATGPETPVYPVGIDDAFGITPSALDGIVEALLTGEYTIEHRMVLRVGVGEESVPALFDATVMTDEPARISEYGVDIGSQDSVDTIRADGVVVASPIGSSCYAAAAGGPTITPGTRTVGVVPISPFTVDRPTWVVDPPVALTVCREEGAVSLYADGAQVSPVGKGETVTIDAQGQAAIATVSAPDEKT